MRKIFTFLLFALWLPATALAAENVPATLIVGGTDVKSGGYWTTDTDGKLTSGSESSWNVHYDASANTLTLNNATIAGASSESTLHNTVGIYASSSSRDVSLTISLQGENTITSNGSGIYVYSSTTGDASLTITGSGSLDASGSQTGIGVVSNGGDAALIINSAEVKAVGGTYTSYSGVWVQAQNGSDVSLTVDGGSLTASGDTGICFQFGTSESGSGTPSLNVSGNAVVKASGGGIVDNSSTDIQIGADSSGNTGGIVFDGGEGTVYGDLTLPEGVTFPENITLNIPKDATLNLPDDFAWPEGIKVTGEGTITPDTEKVPATITLNDDLIFATGNPINLNYTYNGNGQVTITWYEDEDKTQKLQGAPKGGRSYWIELSAEATNLYQAVLKTEEVEVKKGGKAAEIPTVSQTKAGSITVNTVSGQKYICTTSSEPPSMDDSGWIEGTGETYTFENLQPATQYYIHTYFTGNDYLDTSSIVCKDVETLAEYTITFDSQGGSEVAEQTVEEGGKITKPENPTRLNHVFNGWYSDEACTTVWNFDDEVSGSMTLYAKWTKQLIKAEGETEISLDLETGSTTLTAIIESEVDLSAGGEWHWESNDESVAIVTPNEGEPVFKGSATVTAKGAGTAEITATYASDNYTGSVSYTLTVTKAEDPDTPVIPDMPKYYNIMVEECEGVTVETSSTVVREGQSMTFTVDVAEGYSAEDMTVKVKRSLFGTTDIIEPNNEGIYEIKNIYTDIYITVDGVEEEEEETPTGMEDIEGVEVYSKDGSIYVQTPKQERVQIISISGAVVKNETQVGLQRYDLPRGIYIICIGEERIKVRN